MEPKYVLILDFFVGCLNIIRLTDEELRESENYENFEDFLSTIEERYGFRLNSCQWKQNSICYNQIKKRNRGNAWFLFFLSSGVVGDDGSRREYNQVKCFFICHSPYS